MLLLTAQILAGRPFWFLEAQSYSLPSLFSPPLNTDYYVRAYGFRVGRGYYFDDRFGFYVSFGGGVGRGHFTFYAPCPSGDTVMYYLDYNVVPLEMAFGLTYVPIAMEDVIVRVSTEVSITQVLGAYRVLANVLSDGYYTAPDEVPSHSLNSSFFTVPLRFGGEYFLRDNLSVGLEYGLQVLRAFSLKTTVEGKRDTYVFYDLLRREESLKLGVTLYL